MSYKLIKHWVIRYAVFTGIAVGFSLGVRHCHEKEQNLETIIEQPIKKETKPHQYKNKDYN